MKRNRNENDAITVCVIGFSNCNLVKKKEDKTNFEHFLLSNFIAFFPINGSHFIELRVFTFVKKVFKDFNKLIHMVRYRRL